MADVPRPSHKVLPVASAPKLRACSDGGGYGATRGGNGLGMITLGVILLLLGLLLDIGILWTLGVILAIIGVVLAVLGSMDRAVGGRAHYW